MKRPSFQINNLHEHRFQYLDPFPKVHSLAKHTPKLYIDKQIPRKGISNFNMSESCFNHDQLNTIKKKARGTLQWSCSTDAKFASKRKMQMTEDLSFPEKQIHSPVLSFTR